MQCTDSTVPDQSLNSADLRVDTHACMHAHAHTHTQEHACDGSVGLSE
jgi:hypothetical protein